MPPAALLVLLAIVLTGSASGPAAEADVVSAECPGSPNARNRGWVNVHVCRYVHDGLGRMIRQVCDLRVGGTGAGPIDTSNPRNPDGQIALGYVFDGNSRLTGIVDDNGNRTSFGYDALSRKTSHTYADGKGYAFTYDRDDNIRTVTDPNGSVITKTYDALNRLTAVGVARGSGVVGTTLETYSYDGVSRLVRATDDNGAAAATQATEWTYDSLGRMLEERQNGHAISSRYSGDGKRTSVTYPGGRTITRTFDALDRIVDLKQGTQTIATSDWIGPGLRELRRQNGNGTALTFLNDAGNADIGFDAVQRLIRLRVLGAGGAPIVDREYAYNRASQRTSEKRNDDHGLTDTYTYDSAYRIVASAYDQAGLPGAVARELTNVNYVLDGVGNRRDVAKQTSVGLTAESYSVNAVNEYGTVAGVARTHDDNGNLTDDGTRLLAFDYRNRLVGVARKADMRPVAFYGYLPDGRRSRKQVFDPDTGSLLSDTRFLSDGAQEVEEQGWSTGVTTCTYVWSPTDIDGLIQFERTSAHSFGAGTFFVHQDARANVVAITNVAGAVVERRRYDDFGKVEFHDALGAVVGASVVGLDTGFQGRRLDRETGYVYFRARMYDPATGRFLQRDPVWDAGNVGGQYTFCGNGPGSRRDPGGRFFFLAVPAWLAVSAIAGAVVGAGAAIYEAVTTDNTTRLNQLSTASGATESAVTSTFGGAAVGVVSHVALSAIGATAVGAAALKGISAVGAAVLMQGLFGSYASPDMALAGAAMLSLRPYATGPAAECPLFGAFPRSAAPKVPSQELQAATTSQAKEALAETRRDLLAKTLDDLTAAAPKPQAGALQRPELEYLHNSVANEFGGGLYQPGVGAGGRISIGDAAFQGGAGTHRAAA